MQRKQRSVFLLILAAALIAGLLGGVGTAAATGPTTDEPAMWYTITDAPLYGGPEPTLPPIVMLPRGTAVIPALNTPDGAWRLVTTTDGHVGGWIERQWLSAEPPLGSTGLLAWAAPLPEYDAEPAAAIIARLVAMPIVPEFSRRIMAVFAYGQVLGNRANIITTVGDCNMISYSYMQPLWSAESFDLGDYGYLAGTLTFFRRRWVEGEPNPFTEGSAATGIGFTAGMITDGEFVRPGLCLRGEVLAGCEFRRAQPAAALIMLGHNDMVYVPTQAYIVGIRKIVELALANGVIPILTTLPTYPHTALWARAMAYNAALLELAQKYEVPVMNLWLAAQALPGGGIQSDMMHLTETPEAHLGAFDGAEAQWGQALWNLVTLQTLDALRAKLM